jgi:hypothetical protein
MRTKLGTALSAIVISSLWATQAYAICFFGLGDCGGGGGGGDSGGAPEIDGPGALTAIALLLSVGVILYRKVRG